MSERQKILFINVPGSSNKGDIAVTIGHIMGIRKFMPDAEITFWSGNVLVDQLYEAYGVRVKAHPWYIRKRSKYTKYKPWQKRISEKSKLLDMLPKFINFIISLPIIFRTCVSLIKVKIQQSQAKERDWNKYDVVLDTIPDRLNEPFHGFIECFAMLYVTFMARKFFKVPLMLGPSSIGPLNSVLLKMFAKYVLNDIDVIATRDQKSLRYLQELGVSKPKILPLSDMAFLLPAAPSEQVNRLMNELKLKEKKNPIIGIVPRMYMWENADQYYWLMARFIDWLVSRYDAIICLIPHETGMGVYWNDEIICAEIHKRVEKQTSVRIIPGNTNIQLICGLVGKLDVMVSWKLHGAVLATSNFIPTIAVSYGDKFNDLFNNSLQLPELIVDLRKVPFEDVLSEISNTFELVWSNKEAIAIKLKENVGKLKGLALSYSRDVCDLTEKEV